MAAAGRPPTTSGRPSPPPAGRSRSRGSWSSPCTGRTASTPADRAGRAARRLPDLAGGRAAVRRRGRPLPRRRVGAPRPARPVHRRRRRRRPRHAGPRRCSPPGRRAPRRCATSPSRSPRRSGAATRPASSRVAALPGGPDRRRRARQRAARQPAVPPRRARRRLARGVRDRRRPTARSPRCCRAVRPGAGRPPAPAAARRPGAAPGRRAGGGWNDARSLVRRGRVVVVDYARPTTAELALLPWRSWLRTYRGHERGGALPRRPGRAGHHRRRRPRPAPRARRRAHPGAVPAALRHRRARRGGPGGVGERGRARRPGGAGDAQPRPPRPRRCSTQPASAGSPSSSGSARLPPRGAD